MRTEVTHAFRATILVVIYDAWLQWHLAHVLSGAGYEVVLASNGAMAVRLSRVYRCDLIVVVPALPELSGPRLLCALREEPTTHRTPIVVVSESDCPHVARCTPVDAVVAPPCLATEGCQLRNQNWPPFSASSVSRRSSTVGKLCGGG